MSQLAHCLAASSARPERLVVAERSRARRDPSPSEARLLVAVAYHQVRGAPMSWRELGELGGWPKEEAPSRIREMFACGLRWRRGVPRSLGVPPWAITRALAVVREQRAAVL